jgi:glycine oxidase
MTRIIIGNGIVALSIAFGLVRRPDFTEQITVIGPSARPGAATPAAAAMLNSFAEIEHGALETEIDLFRFEMSHTATRLWPAFETALIEASGDRIPHGCSACQGCAGGGCFGTGTYVINNTATDDLDDKNFDAILEALSAFNEQHSHVSPSDIPGYAPQQRFRATRAVLIHNEGWFNPRLMLEKMEAALKRSGRVTFVDDEVLKLSMQQGTIAAVELKSGSIVEGDQFVLASGASVSGVIARSNIGLTMPRVFYGIGTSIEIRSVDHPLTNVIRTPNRGLACGLYAVPYFLEPNRPNNHVLIGASNFIAPELHHHGRLTSIEGLLSGAISQFNANYYRADLIRVNVGARPTSQDSYPLIGGTAISNLYIVSGTRRDGFHLAPLISDIMSKMMSGDSVDERYKMFRPDRKPIKGLTRQQAVEKAVRHQMSAAYQHGFTPAMSRMPEQLEQQMRDAVERLHDQVGAKDWGIPPDMLDMYRYGHAQA